MLSHRCRRQQSASPFQRKVAFESSPRVRKRKLAEEGTVTSQSTFEIMQPRVPALSIPLKMTRARANNFLNIIFPFARRDR